MNIVDATNAAAESMAVMLFDGFSEHWPKAWPTIEASRAEVAEALGSERIRRIAVDGSEVLGWIGAIPQYRGHVWELHPLVVRADRRRKGIGRALVQDLEALVAARGGLVITLGTDDEDDMTSIGGIELFPDPLAHLARLSAIKGHPFGFYLRCGFVLTGVVPDANGIGRPDILMAKRLPR